MNRADLLNFHERICSDARALMERKNHDYTGKGGDSPFANFTRTESLGICTTEQGFLVRMSDKLSRLASFASSGDLKVKDESVRDTLVDLINYSVLLAGYLADKDAEDADEVWSNGAPVIDAEAVLSAAHEPVEKSSDLSTIPEHAS